MAYLLLKIYRALFAKKFFYKLNRFLYRCSLSGLGVLNYENDKVGGEARFIKNYLKGRPKCVVFDVGANVGNYSKGVLEFCPQAMIYAFEPHPKNFEMLTKNLSGPNFVLINSAGGEAEGSLSLYDYENNDGSTHASLYKDVIENIHKGKSIQYEVQVISLADFSKKENIEKIDLLKVDTEGNELNVLRGCRDYIKLGKIGAIQFEFNEMNVSSRTFFRDFWELLPNYDFYRLLPDGMVKIERYNPIFCEIYAYQNIVAILKHGL